MFPGVKEETEEKKDYFLCWWTWVKVCQHSLGAVIKMKLRAVGCLSWVADQRKAAWWDLELSNITKLVFTSGFSFLFAFFFPMSFKQDTVWRKCFPMHRAGSVLTWGRFRRTKSESVRLKETMRGWWRTLLPSSEGRQGWIVGTNTFREGQTATTRTGK